MFHIKHVVIMKVIKLLFKLNYCYCTLQSGRTPLYAASERRNEKVVEILITAGADVNTTDEVSYCQSTLTI